MVKYLGRRKFRTEVLHGLDVDVYSGQMTLLVGPSGCGKTTLISTIAGILKPDKGSIALFGTAMADLGRRRITRFRGRNVGLVLQQFHLFPALTAAENVAVPLLVFATVRGTPRRGRRACWKAWALQRTWINIRASSRSASSSALPLRAPSPTTPPHHLR